MEKRLINTLIVGDNELECNCKSLNIDKINISNVSFKDADLEKFDLIVYKGKKGQKILRSSITKLGVIKN